MTQKEVGKFRVIYQTIDNTNYLRAAKNLGFNA